MGLLPKSSKEFSNADYWEAFFKNRGNKVFEWYGEFFTLQDLLVKYVKSSDKILIPGCGTSELGIHMHDFGYKNITCTDIIQDVVDRMKKYCDDKPGLIYQVMDIFKMEYAEGEFNVILDKGILDALYSQDDEASEKKIEKMFAEISRVLKIGGRYLCITLAQSYIAEKILEYFSNEGWLVRVCLNSTSTKKNQSDLPVFMFVLTKFKKMPNAKPILEMSLIDNSVQRVNRTDEVLTSITELQNYALVKNNLQSGKLLEKQISLELHDSTSSEPRYMVHVVDGRGKKNQKFAVFIVPLGRESEWLFSSEEGRKQLHESCGFGRLIVVCLNRKHNYESIDAIKQELSPRVPQLASHLINVENSPFLSLGDSADMTISREFGNSELSGGYVVEDVKVDNEVRRRLVFNSLPNVIQTEVVLQKEAPKKGAKKFSTKPDQYVIDHGSLTCKYYKPVIAGLIFTEPFASKRVQRDVNVALIGLGGGSLSMHIHENFSKVKLTAVELDPEIVKVAEKHFGLKQNDRLSVVVADGLEFIKEKQSKGKKKYDMLIVDVDNKESSLGISCPPQSFLEEDVFKACCEIVSPKGVFVLNLATRSTEMRNSVVESLKSTFRQVYGVKVDQDINFIMYCLPYSLVDGTKSFNDVIAESFDRLKNSMKNKNQGVFNFQPRDIKLM